MKHIADIFKYYSSRLYYKIVALSSPYFIPGSITAFWWNREINFGDLLTPYLIRKYGAVPIYTFPHYAKIVSTGSILEHLPEYYNGVILGSGLMFETSSKDFSAANVIAVRGRRTLERIKTKDKPFFGDPGLLVKKFFKCKVEKEFVLGIIPHMHDKNNENIEIFIGKYKKRVLLIDPQRDPESVINDILKCENILSSSLHGLITADALEIPNAWLAPGKNIIGGCFKFYDYFSSVGRESEPLIFSSNVSLINLIKQMNKVSPHITGELAEKLDSSFSKILCP